MPGQSINLAIETSSAQGSVSLGRDDQLLGTRALAQDRRHNLALMPAIDALFQAHSAAPADLAELYVSIGPRSFTGLRVAVATAKMFAQTLGTRIVAVPTLDVLAQNALADATLRHLAVTLNTKRDTVWAALFEKRGEFWALAGEPALFTMPQLLEAAPRPLAILGDPLPEIPAPFAGSADITVLPPTLAIPHSEVLWQLGRTAARRGQFTEPMALLPLYAREPEAVTLWEKKGRA